MNCKKSCERRDFVLPSSSGYAIKNFFMKLKTHCVVKHGAFVYEYESGNQKCETEL